MAAPLRGGSGLNFAIVGEGSDRRIFAFASVSSLTLSGGESQRTDHGWNCNRCSYENADAWSIVCPVCGYGKDGANHNSKQRRTSSIRKNGRHPLAHEMSLSVESLMLQADDDDKDTPSVHIKSATSLSQTDSQKLQKEFMMSYANWSLSDKGGWICSSCTFLNQDSLHLTCDVCQQVRPTKEIIAAPPSQRSFQEFMNASVAKLGQEESFQQQRERLLQLEERALEEERMKEIALMQHELFAKIAAERDEKKKREALEEIKEEASPPPSPRQHKDAEAKEIVYGCLDEIEEAKRVLERTQERIKRLEMLRQQQMEEQMKMEEMLQQQTEMSKRACSIGGNDTLSPEYLAQQKMLDFWREEFESREGRMAEIRKLQEDLLRNIRQQQEQ